MEIAPRYDGPPILELDAGGDEVRAAFLRQHRRLVALLGGLTEAAWATPSRCAGWTVQDVAAHLEGVDRFWHASIAAALVGEPTRFLVGFDPRATPAAMVEGVRDRGPAEALAALVEAAEALCSLVEEIEGAAWELPGEAPPGHLPLRVVLHHALWDSWVHERDVVLPLGLVPTEEPDEVVACLRYAAALGPALAVASGTATPDALVLEVSAPDVTVVADVGLDRVRVHGGPVPAGGLVLRGRAVEVVERLSVRSALPDGEVPDDRRWLVGTLAEVFG